MEEAVSRIFGLSDQMISLMNSDVFWVPIFAVFTFGVYLLIKYTGKKILKAIGRRILGIK